MCQVSVELVFPLSCAVDRKNSHEITLNEEITLEETLGSLLVRLGQHYPNLCQNLFDVDKKELSPYILVTLNDRSMDTPEILRTKLNDGDKICVLPVYLGG